MEVSQKTCRFAIKFPLRGEGENETVFIVINTEDVS